MNRQQGSVTGVLLVVLVAAVLVQSVVLVALFRKVSELENGDGTPVANGPAPISVQQEVRELRDRVEAEAKLRAERETEFKEEIAAIRTGAALPAAPDAPAAAKGEDLEALVEKAVEKKIEEEVPNRGGGEWKPSMEEFKDSLKLNEQQAQQAERVLDDGKAELFKLAGLRREDGFSLLDDLVDAVSHPDDPEGAMREWFQSLFREKIPGRDETYIVEVIRMKERTEKSLAEVLDEDQAKKMRRLNIDYFGVKTGYDPFAEYVQEALK